MIAAFLYEVLANDVEAAVAMAIGGVLANLFSMALVLIEANKTKDDF